MKRSKMHNWEANAPGKSDRSPVHSEHSVQEQGGILALIAILIALGAVLLYAAGSIGLQWDQTANEVATNTKLAKAAQSSVSGLQVWRLDSDGIPQEIGGPALVDPVLQDYLDDACQRTVVDPASQQLSGQVFKVTLADCSSVTTADLIDISNCVACSGAAPDCAGLDLEAERAAQQSGELGSCMGLFLLTAKAGDASDGRQVSIAVPMREAAPQNAVAPSVSPSASPSSSPAIIPPTPTPTSTPAGTPTPVFSPPPVYSPPPPEPTETPVYKGDDDDDLIHDGDHSDAIDTGDDDDDVVHKDGEGEHTTGDAGAHF